MNNRCKHATESVPNSRLEEAERCKVHSDPRDGPLQTLHVVWGGGEKMWGHHQSSRKLCNAIPS